MIRTLAPLMLAAAPILWLTATVATMLLYQAGAPVDVSAMADALSAPFQFLDTLAEALAGGPRIG